ncbi:MAG: hypothetical protein ACUVWX_00560 [Kiritimatiellia bacterium]
MHADTPRNALLAVILSVPLSLFLCLPVLGANTVPFSDGFEEAEGHTNGAPVVGVKGWTASSTNAIIVDTYASEGSQSVYVPQDESITNEITTAISKIWTRFYTRAKLYDGVAANRPTNGLPPATALFFFSSNGYVVVRSSASWVEKTKDVGNNDMFRVDSNIWTKVDVFSDYGGQQWSLFLTSNSTATLVADAVPFWRSASQYSFFAARDDVYVDDLLVTTNAPAELSSLDVDGDSMGDTWEMYYFGSASAKDGSRDSDGGGAIDRVEFQFGTNPLDKDDDPLVMPYFEDFEQRTNGYYSPEMNIYLHKITPSVTNKVKVINTDHAESDSGFAKCLEIEPTAGVSLTLNNTDGTNVVVTMYLKPSLMNDADPELGPNDSAGFFVKQDGTVRVYDGNEWTNLSQKVHTNRQWLGFAVHLDYNSRKWDLYVSTNEVYGEPMVRIGTGLNINTNATGTYLVSVAISNTADSTTARLDDLALNYMGHNLRPGGSQNRLSPVEKRASLTQDVTKMVALPYEYSSGKDTLATDLGRDLARECNNGDTIRIFFAQLGGWSKFERTSPGGVPSWSKVSGSGTVNTPVRAWMPIVMTRYAPSVSLVTPVAWQEESQPLQNMPLYAGGPVNGWNLGYWMKGTKALNATPRAFNSCAETGDEIRSESYPGVRIYYRSGNWYEGSSTSTKYIYGGKWFFYRNRSVNNTLTWSAE